MLLDCLAGLNINVTEVLERAGIDQCRFRSGEAALTAREFADIFEALETLSGTRDLGLRLAEKVVPHQLDVPSLAALHSRNLGEALNVLARYRGLIHPGHVDIALRENEALVTFHWSDFDEKPPAALVDFILASFVAIARRGSALRIAPLRVELARRSSDSETLKKHFGSDIWFEAPLNTLVFERSTLARPFVTRNEKLTSLLLSALETELRDALKPRSVADEVKSILQHHLRGKRVSVDNVAKKMSMSSRTLQRRLEALGTNYQALLDDVRRETARRLLSDSDLDVGEIALQLGFDEANSFTRAFSGWEGATPTRWLAQNRIL